MPRYFYLLLLLLTINWTFCYDYIADSQQNKHGRRLRKMLRNQKSRHEDNDYFRRKGQEFETDKDPLAHIDVARFIQKPDEYSVDENWPYEMDNNRKKTKLKHENDYGSVLGFSPDEYIMKRSKKQPYYLNPKPDNSFDFGPDPLLLKDTINSRHLNLDSLSLHGLNNVKVAGNPDSKSSFDNYKGFYDTNDEPIHRAEKKSVLKYMKFPFFSHNKTESSKSRKEKRKKAFCFNCSKKNNKSSDIAVNDTLKVTSNKENVETLSKTAMNAPSDSFNNLKTQTKRGKRDYWTNANDRQRQLQELEEIQRKVDSVEITSTYQKSA